MNASRRAFLSAATGIAAAGLGRTATPLAMNLAGLGALAASQAQAANVSDGYKALVCLYMAGGNDSHNWVVPMDATNYASYAAARGDLALPLNKLLALSSSGQASGRSFGMPLELAPLRQRYELGQCAVVANVGTLVRPITKAEFAAGGAGIPAKLFSHNDQQSTWQSLKTEGAPSGWGGRMGDALMSANQQPVFTAVGAGGNAVFLAGAKVTPYYIGVNGLVQINAAQDGWRAGSTAVPGALRSMLNATSSPNDFQAEYIKVAQRSLNTTAALQSAINAGGVPALPTAPIALPNGLSMTLANENIAKQLRIVAQMISAGPALGMKRQVFMVNIGGFDSHAFQMRDQPLQMSRVAQSIDWFMATMQNLGMLNNVTLFTASDFGRTLLSNGDGSDHGWGSHHFVVGGAVQGKRIVGNFPVTALGTAEDVGSGRLLPSTSVTQFASSLAGWMGLSTTEQQVVLPNLSSFGAGPSLFA
jgi:uncharacterized protein (DUF1501 family)